MSDHDVVIIGSGAAGGMAAYTLTKLGVSVRRLETPHFVIYTDWEVVDDEFPVLLSPDYPEAVIFTPGSQMHIGARPET